MNTNKTYMQQPIIENGMIMMNYLSLQWWYNGGRRELDQALTVSVVAVDVLLTQDVDREFGEEA